MKPFFGYPGGKSRAAPTIKSLLNFDPGDYTRIIEPFCGGGSFSLSCGAPAHLNDLDADLMCLWTAVRDYPDKLCSGVEGREVYSDLFYELRQRLKNIRPFPSRPKQIVARALDKLTVHKLSYSNMGEMSGSPVGGKNQTGKWKFDVRWNVESICKSIRKASEAIQGWRLTCEPYWAVLGSVQDTDFVFIDPPYYVAGAKCYKHCFSHDDHVKLAERVKGLRATFAVTYDTHPEIIEMYQGLDIYSLQFKYFMSSAYRSDKTMKIGKELLISNK